MLPLHAAEEAKPEPQHVLKKSVAFLGPSAVLQLLEPCSNERRHMRVSSQAYMYAGAYVCRRFTAVTQRLITHLIIPYHATKCQQLLRVAVQRQPNSLHVRTCWCTVICVVQLPVVHTCSQPSKHTMSVQCHVQPNTQSHHRAVGVFIAASQRKCV